MSYCRVAFALGLLAFVLAPLLSPFREIIDPAVWRWSSDDVERLTGLGRNTLAMTAGTFALALPIGVGLAVLLFRTSFVGRRVLLFLLGLILFIPLPVLVSSWQGFFGPDGFLPSSMWSNAEGRPWVSGLSAAIWIHTMAAVPWVAFIVGIGLTWVEPEVEEEAAQSVGPWRVLMLVTLPRVRASILAAGLFVIVQTAGEVSVADMMQVRTLAEETRSQFERGDGTGVARTLLLALPALIAAWAAVGLLAWRLEQVLPPLVPAARDQRPLALSWPAVRFAKALALLAIVAMPLVSMFWKLGPAASGWHELQKVAILHTSTLAQTIATALLTSVLVTLAALIGCWLARDSRWFRWLLFGLAIWAWIVPGPVVGIGLKGVIKDLVELWPDGPLAESLYYAPSPLPVMWAQGLRVFPIAVLFLWPIVRMVPGELFEEARLGGAGAWSEFTHVVWPMTWRGAAVTTLATMALCLSEVAASVRVETAGWPMFTTVLYDRMHYGANNTVAALCVLLLSVIAALGVLGWMTRMVWKVCTRGY